MTVCIQLLIAILHVITFHCIPTYMYLYVYCGPYKVIGLINNNKCVNIIVSNSKQFYSLVQLTRLTLIDQFESK